MYDCFHGNDAVFAYLFSSMQVKKNIHLLLIFKKNVHACIKVMRLLMILQTVSFILFSNLILIKL